MSDPELTLSALERAAEQVHAVLAPTPQIAWPLLAQRLGAEVWVKHENHQPIGAFKVRGGLLAISALKDRGASHVIAATRGNHGQSVAFAARRLGIRATIVVPERNCIEKNRAMRALGAEVVEEGHDFQAAYEHAVLLAEQCRAHLVPSFSVELVSGVASCALELFRATGPLDRLYVPIGLGSGICGAIAARDALGYSTEIVGVVAAGADCYARSFAARAAVATGAAVTIADGLACRVPNPQALERILRGAARVVAVDDATIRAAIRIFFADTHNAAEGAGAAALAAALRERSTLRGLRIGLVLSGGNIDRKLLATVLSEGEIDEV
jgi:threonine dehydratase